MSDHSIDGIGGPSSISALARVCLDCSPARDDGTQEAVVFMKERKRALGFWVVCSVLRACTMTRRRSSGTEFGWNDEFFSCGYRLQMVDSGEKKKSSILRLCDLLSRASTLRIFSLQTLPSFQEDRIEGLSTRSL
jgi:hypothetical protein